MNTEHPPFSLHNIELFKKKLDIPLYNVLDKYSHLIHEYITFIFENISIKKPMYTRFIIFRGLDTITNVFQHILYYTKNIDLAYFHSQKSFYFYVEFVGQISNDQNTFLQLNSRDAALYVYKKTIFEINHEHKKKSISPSPEENQKYRLFDEHTKIYKLLFSKMMNEEDFLSNNHKNEYLTELDNILKKMNECDFTLKELEPILLLVNKLIHLNISTQIVFECFLLLVKKNKIKTIMKEKLYSEDAEYYLKEPPTKLIKWVTTS
jgi:hypothetical protein